MSGGRIGGGELLCQEQCAVRGIAVQCPKISQPVSSEDLTYGVSQLWLMDQDSAAKHHGQRRRRPADCHLHRSDEVGEVGGGVIDDPPGGCVPNGGQLEYHPGVPGPVAAFWIGVEVIDELALVAHWTRR